LLNKSKQFANRSLQQHLISEQNLPGLSEYNLRTSANK